MGDPSATSVFSSLTPALQAALAHLGISDPTAPQVAAIPKLLAGDHVLVVAPTGIGKTEAAMLPILELLLRTPAKVEPGVRALYITPLRALNRDLLLRLQGWAASVGVDLQVRHGDTSQSERRRLARKPPDVLITTPETLQILLVSPRLREQLKSVAHVVIDEIHELATSERGAQLMVGLERLEELRGAPFQRIGLSATVGDVGAIASFLGGVDRHVEAVVVSVPKGQDVLVVRPVASPRFLASVQAKLQPVPEDDLCAILEAMLAEIAAHRSTLVFVNTRDAAESLTVRLRRLGAEGIGVHHGSLSKEGRVAAEEEFKAGRLRALVCTSSLELGIDIGTVEATVQYNSPRQVAHLVQRIGRSGHRLGLTSVGRVLATHPDELTEAAVIARRALAGELERPLIRASPLTVLANQLQAMALEGPFPLEEAYVLLRRSAPFADLSWQTFVRTLRLLASLRVLWFEELEGTFGKKQRGMFHFYENLSMIADQRTYRVRDITTRGVVGTLDEDFVISYLAQGVAFIVAGSTWRVVELQEEEVLASPDKEVGALPSWVGEQIPVPQEVAQEVGALRRSFEAGQGIASHYPLDPKAREAIETVLEHHLQSAPLATDQRITIEPAMGVGGSRLIILQAPLGSAVTATLGLLVASLLEARIGVAVHVRTDPYRIQLEVPRRVEPSQVAELLRRFEPATLPETLRIIARSSPSLKREVLHAARKIGALHAGIDPRSVRIDRLLERFETTPLGEEAIERTIELRMDEHATLEVLGAIAEGRLEIVVLDRPTVLGGLGLSRGLELIGPGKATSQVLAALRKRLEERTVRTLCLHCGSSRRSRIGAIVAPLRCTKCSAVMVALATPFHEEEYQKVIAAKVRGSTLSAPQKKSLAQMQKVANLLHTYGRAAALALAARGVGPEVAARILRKEPQSEEDLLRELLEAEVTFARTKQYWA